MILFLASIAFAGTLTDMSAAKQESRGCVRTTTLSLAVDTAHTVWKTHTVDVAAWLAEHPLGFRDYRPLVVDAGKGELCLQFGTVRPFGEAIGDYIGVAVSVNGGKPIVIADTNITDLDVTGLRPDDVVTVDFLEGYPPVVDSCKWRSNTFVINSVDGADIPQQVYDCRVVERKTYFVVLEHPEHKYDTSWKAPPPPKSTTPSPFEGLLPP